MGTSNGDLRIEIGDLTCTLEGFDDPVEAMAAISSYLRALEEREAGGAPVEVGALRRILELARSVRVAEAAPPGSAAAPAGNPAARPPGDRTTLSGARTDQPRDEGSGTGPDEAVLARILSEADRHLAAPEARRRREALARLKAAFASLGRRAAPDPARAVAPPPEGGWAEPFRDDLREAVGRAPGPPERR
ncbi:hypothetical protein [Rubellimicrobium aerolatum]|uniref:Uncharacterized protein n=1 Tax=Rubellimicrobium aerolatum TaxID=490979 RepID=A0ABW0SEF9_9RHOB|nr:hypothetical protein [Rubellimicrobium aerolatum]MBP1805777.1 hypothetical protein [Rubellimicrobium aerolatum]